MDPEQMTDDEWDAQLMFEYLDWRTGPYYREDLDMGTPASALYAAGIEYAYQNDEALQILEPRLAQLNLTLREALVLLVAKREGSTS